MMGVDEDGKFKLNEIAVNDPLLAAACTVVSGPKITKVLLYFPVMPLKTDLSARTVIDWEDKVLS